jgi:hypothetical protein
LCSIGCKRSDTEGEGHKKLLGERSANFTQSSKTPQESSSILTNNNRSSSMSIADIGQSSTTTTGIRVGRFAVGYDITQEIGARARARDANRVGYVVETFAIHLEYYFMN